MNWPGRYFSPKEVLSPKALKVYKEMGINLFNLEALRRFDDIREALGSPMLVNFGDLTLRGYRTPEENKAIGGAPFSYHMAGMAIDVTCDKVSTRELYKFLVDNHQQLKIGALGFYPYANFVHIDVRPSRVLVTWEQRR